MSTKRRIPAFVAIGAAIFSILYLANPTGGFVEFIPDNLPFFGNLDEAGVTTLLIWAINELRQRGNAPIPPRDVTPPFRNE
jgi:uncharacterized membrane protein YkvA (DUF1232 family)